MTKDQFSCLFVNINSLAELGLRFAAAEVDEVREEGLLGDLVETTERAANAAGLEGGFDNLDFNALDGLDFFDDDSNEKNLFESAESEPVLPNSNAVNGFADDKLNSDSLPFDIDVYMKQAYAYQDQLKVRVDQSYNKADHARVDVLLSRCPETLSNLTDQMTGNEMNEWLALYKTGADPIIDLVVMIRQLDL